MSSDRGTGQGDQGSNGRPGDTTNATTPAEEQPHYQWPPPRDPNLAYRQKSRNPVHALITALPLVMLIAGFYIYYSGESRQTGSTPIQAESVRLNGIFTGMSATSGRHYLWIEQADAIRSIRIQKEQVPALDDLVRGKPVEVQAAPSVHKSTTYWALRVEQSGKTYLDMLSVRTLN